MNEIGIIILGISFAVGLIITIIGNSRGWSMLKKILVTLAVLAGLNLLSTSFFSNFSLSSNSNSLSSGDKLVDIATEYVRSQLNSPSTAVFHGFVRAEKFREITYTEWGITLPSNCDIVIIDVEATNGLGGRIRTNYAVFFKNGQPIDMIDASELDNMKLRQAISWMGY